MDFFLHELTWRVFLPRFFLCLLPIFSLYCVTRLNNQGDAKPTTIFLTLLLLLFLLATVSKTFFIFQFTNNLMAWFVYAFSCSLLLGTTFRGSGGFWGFDINSEYFSAVQVANKGFWLPPQGNSAYDSMLSITVLPVVLSIFTKFNLVFIFKVFFSLVLSFIPTVIFSVGSKYFSRLSVLVVLIGTVFGSISFFPQLPALARQIVAVSFLMGLLLVPHQTEWKRRHKTIMVLLMSTGIAISHYSTAYLVSAIFGLSIIPVILIFIISPRTYAARKGVFTVSTSLGIILISFLWNGVFTHSVEALKPVEAAISNEGLSLLPNKQQNILLSWIGGTIPQQVYRVSDLEKLDRTANFKKGVQSQPESLAYPIEAVKFSGDYIFGQRFARFFGNLTFISRTFFQLASFVGSVIFIWLFFKSKRSNLYELSIFGEKNLIFDVFPIAITSLLLGLVARVSGTLAPFYNPERVALTIALVLLIPTIMVVELLLFGDYIARVILVAPVVAFAFVLVLNATSLGGYFLGSDTVRISPSQADRSPFIISENERSAARWLGTNVSKSGYLQTDSRGFLALLQQGRNANYASIDPYSLVPHAYIYASNMNVQGGVVNSFILYKFPKDYINGHYDLIYSSPRAQVYH
jgi:uncharacterized membrane protein